MESALFHAKDGRTIPGRLGRRLACNRTTATIANIWISLFEEHSLYLIKSWSDNTRKGE